MQEFDDFERREMALQSNGKWYAQNILAQLKAKNENDMQRLSELRAESKHIWAEKQAIYAGIISVQEKAVRRWLGQ